MGKLIAFLSVAGATAACAVAAYLVTERLKTRFQRSQVQAILDDFREKCAIPVEKLLKIVDAMNREMQAGLNTTGGSKLKMLPSFVDRLPDGSEDGLYYALDLGGTNFRVLRILLVGTERKVAKQEFEEVSIPPELMTGSTEELFDFIASGLASFVAKEVELKPGEGRVRELGFTFSFPCEQTAIDKGTLIKWTKGFKVQGTEGKDVVIELQEALRRKKVDMVVSALVNDTVGALAGARYHDPDAMIGVILGTGTNACYVEKVDAIPKLNGLTTPSGQMVINMEWGNFWTSDLPWTHADELLDEGSLNPGEQRFEKLISGMYLGEVARIVLLKMATEAALFGPIIPPRLEKSGSFPTPKLSKIDHDTSPDLSVVGEVLDQLFEVGNVPVGTRQVVQSICAIVRERGARLATAGIVGVLKRINRDGAERTKGTNIQRLARTGVAIDGGLFEHYPNFRADMKAALEELLGEDAATSVPMYLSSDGSGLGAALLAASNSMYSGSGSTNTAPPAPDAAAAASSAAEAT
eukprot:TRINITY_DN1225_c0_g1_i2.p1 TRINITY_DN1225_c0_g1~~TRINITY_DN1225_c0_g1_i2.p1  ORF type:complete len:524 (-),score=132.79 TRINITY_DN1225_c0_g1_i2:401-1972(-)